MPNWSDVLKEIQRERDDINGLSAIDKVRMRYLSKLSDHVGRNVIGYYSGFLSKSSKIEGMEINDEDKNGFMTCVHKMDRSKGLDLIIHTPGGRVASTESLVHYLKQMFGNNIRAFVPQIAMSAGTMLACACKEIYMGKQSNIGPVDPLLNGIPAYAVIKEIERAYNEISVDKNKAYVWNPILSRYTPGFVQQCHWAIQHSKQMVIKFLKDNMLHDNPDRDVIAAEIVERLTDLSSDKGHDKHIHYEDCLEMGLIVKPLEDPQDKTLQDLMLTVHHCYMFTLSNSGCFKIIENQLGRRMVKLQVTQQVFMPIPEPINNPALDR